ncbi:MAG: hypothetical protein LBS64_05420 [Spirochaetaceae bacterium]|nr:hypothetical protein [Spirochaetaceae bacterium]
MTNVLSLIERDIIISLLTAEHIILHIVFTQKNQETATFRVETGVEGVRVSAPEGIIKFTKTIPQLDLYEGKNAVVVFYFKKLGLTFTAPLQKFENTLEIVVPQTVMRLSEEEKNAERQVMARLFFAISGKADVSIPCVPNRRLPLFQVETWQYFSNKNADEGAKLLGVYLGAHICQIPITVFEGLYSSGRLLYKSQGKLPTKSPFPIDLCVLEHEWNDGTAEHIRMLRELPGLNRTLYMPIGRPPTQGDGGLAVALGGSITQEKIEELIYLSAVCNYLTLTDEAPAAATIDPAMEIEQRQFSLIFLSDKLAVLGGNSDSFPLVKNQEYALQIVCRSGLMNRAIYTTCFISDIFFLRQTQRSCALALFTGLKAEDRRFLFEKQYGSVFR